MDAFDNPNDKPATHYEMISDLGRIEAAASVKGYAFKIMDQLDGWCSKFKASVLMDLVFLLKPDVVVEIGVFGGKSLVPMAIACRANNKGTVIGIDPWATDASVEGMEGANLTWWGTIDHEAVLNTLVDRVNKFDLNDRIVLIRGTSESVAPIENIDILHVDGNHSEKAALYDLQKWVPLVRKGGAVILDDINWEGPRKAIEWLDQNCIKLATFNDSGSDWGVWIKM